MERELDPNEVARLLALPESDPERIRAMRDPEMASLALALEAFETQPAGVDAGTLESVRAELRERLASASGPGMQAPRRLAREAPARPGGFFGWFSMPAARAALAFAGVLVLGGIAWWSFGSGSRHELVRGLEDSSTFRMLEPRNAGDQLVLSWTPVPNAERYRVRFLGPDLGVIADTDAGSSTSIVLRRDALPRGLGPGVRLAAEVVAMRGSAELATTEARQVQLP